eukprot:11219838-Heterocapsa_arctica.AAC.1
MASGLGCVGAVACPRAALTVSFPGPAVDGCALPCAVDVGFKQHGPGVVGAVANGGGDKPTQCNRDGGVVGLTAE